MIESDIEALSRAHQMFAGSTRHPTLDVGTAHYRELLQRAADLNSGAAPGRYQRVVDHNREALLSAARTDVAAAGVIAGAHQDRAHARELTKSVLDEARAGRSGVLAIVGEVGIGKSALLAYAGEQAAGMNVLRARGVQSEAHIPFGSLLELLRPALSWIDRIPSPQAEALGSALALRAASAPGRFAVGAGTLSLLAAYSEQAPVVVLVDDAHWLDGSSADALLFAFRRLVADPVAVILAVPALFLLLILATSVAPSPLELIVVLSFLAWQVPSRLVRGESLTLRTREFVQAVQVMGGGSARAVIRHIIPNTVSTIVVNATFQVADAILILAVLSYLGFGLPPPAATWGGMLSDGSNYIYAGYWWQIYPVGVLIVIVVIAFNFLGDALRDLCVELCQAYFGFQLRSRLGILWRHRLTGTTPRSPEVHDHRNVITLDVTAEIVPGELDRLTRKQRLMAMPTLRCLAEARGGSSVDRVAVGAHDVGCI